MRHGILCLGVVVLLGPVGLCIACGVPVQLPVQAQVQPLWLCELLVLSVAVGGSTVVFFLRCECHSANRIQPATGQKEAFKCMCTVFKTHVVCACIFRCPRRLQGWQTSNCLCVLQCHGLYAYVLLQVPALFGYWYI